MNRCRLMMLVCVLLGGCAKKESLPDTGESPNDPKPRPQARRAEEDALDRLERTFRVKAVRDETRPIGPVVTLELSGPIGKVGDTRAFDEELEVLSAFPSLRELRMTGCRITGEGMKHLGKLTDLRRLALTSSQVTDAGIKSMPTLPNLEQVELGATRVTDDGLIDLKRQPKLRALHFSEDTITQRGLDALASFPALRRVETGGEGHTDAELIALTKIPGLEYLVFWAHDGVTREGIAALAGCKNLTSLRLELQQLAPGALAPLRERPLERVSLGGRFVGDEAAAEIARWGHVRHLRLGFNKGLSDEGLRSIAAMSRLESLELPHAGGITDAGMVHVGEMTGLRLLNLRGTRIGDKGVETLARLIHLLALNLSVDSDVKVTGAALRHLRALGELEELDLFGMAITDADIDVIARFRKLKRINLAATQVTQDGAARLRKLLPGAEVK